MRLWSCQLETHPLQHLQANRIKHIKIKIEKTIRIQMFLNIVYVDLQKLTRAGGCSDCTVLFLRLSVRAFCVSMARTKIGGRKPPAKSAKFPVKGKRREPPPSGSGSQGSIFFKLDI